MLEGLQVMETDDINYVLTYIAQRPQPTPYWTVVITIKISCRYAYSVNGAGGIHQILMSSFKLLVSLIMCDSLNIQSCSPATCHCMKLLQAYAYMTLSIHLSVFFKDFSHIAQHTSCAG